MKHVLAALVLAFLLNGCSTQPGTINKPLAKGWYAKTNEQCVPFARRASGIEIYGNAHTWWRKANKNKRTKRPYEGAVMVLSKTRRLRYGHLAVVKDIVDSRHIDVTHTNWGGTFDTRRVVYDSMRVKDVSKNNDWSSAVFWNPHTEAYGRPYKVSGFIVK